MGITWGRCWEYTGNRVGARWVDVQILGTPSLIKGVHSPGWGSGGLKRNWGKKKIKKRQKGVQ